MNATVKARIIKEYKPFLDKYGRADMKKTNKAFFQWCRDNIDENLKDASIRGLLSALGLYEAHCPRMENKKGGKKKEEWCQELEKMLGVELPSLRKMTIADIRAIIEHLQ